MHKVTHYLLTTDKSSSRRLRRIVAERYPMLGVVIGTWSELLTFLWENYHLPKIIDVWDSTLRDSARIIPDAFWSKSLEVAEKETLQTVSNALSKLLEGKEPGIPFRIDNLMFLPERAGRHLIDLVRLYEKMGNVLPAHLSAISTLLLTDKPVTSRQVIVYHGDNIKKLSPWQKALLNKIAIDSAAPMDPQLETLYRLSGDIVGAGNPNTALFHFQNELFNIISGQTKRDDSIQWVAARDYLEEVDVTAGMIQTALIRDTSLRYEDIGLLLPTDSVYARAVRTSFESAGIPVSALTYKTSLRDIGRETVTNFLLALREPAPLMALASLVTSPLMPWTTERGVVLATSIMGGDINVEELYYPLKHVKGETAGPTEIDEALLGLSRFITAGIGMEEHLGRARQTISEIRGLLQRVESIPWKEIMALSAPDEYSRQVKNGVTREGVAIFSENEEPWRQIRYLFILGFNHGHYPVVSGVSSVFTEADIQNLNTHLGYCLETLTEIAQHRRGLFKRQLMSASEHVTLFMSRRDGLGKTIHSAETLTFMAQLLEGTKSPEELVYDLDNVSDRDRIHLLSRAVKSKALESRTLSFDDINLSLDLLKLRTTKEGEQKPESPSGLETMIVSPLAWLFRRFNMEPKEWVPEKLDMMGKGTLAHSVFEQLFVPGKDLPNVCEIRRQIPLLLRNAIVELMPFLLSSEWRVEHRHLERDIEDAALRWGEILRHLKAKVSGVEVTLQGQLDGLPLTGNADLLLKLPNGRLYIVDYKKAKSKSRRERMNKGYDIQAHLYRVMLQTGGIAEENQMLESDINQCKQIGVMYYMLNDQVALADTSNWSGGKLGGFHELGEEISVNAMDLIKERICQLEQGIVALNSVEDEKWFEKNARMKPYALDNSPLIRLFMKYEQSLLY